MNKGHIKERRQNYNQPGFQNYIKANISHWASEGILILCK